MRNKWKPFSGYPNGDSFIDEMNEILVGATVLLNQVQLY